MHQKLELSLLFTGCSVDFLTLQDLGLSDISTEDTTGTWTQIIQLTVLDKFVTS